MKFEVRKDVELMLLPPSVYHTARPHPCSSLVPFCFPQRRVSGTSSMQDFDMQSRGSVDEGSSTADLREYLGAHMQLVLLEPTAGCSWSEGQGPFRPPPPTSLFIFALCVLIVPT